MRALTAEMAHLSVATQGEAKPVAPELTKEVIGDFEKVEGRPTWMIQHTALLKASYLDGVMEEVVDDDTRAKEGLK